MKVILSICNYKHLKKADAYNLVIKKKKIIHLPSTHPTLDALKKVLVQYFPYRGKLKLIKCL